MLKKRSDQPIDEGELLYELEEKEKQIGLLHIEAEKRLKLLKRAENIERLYNQVLCLQDEQLNLKDEQLDMLNRKLRQLYYFRSSSLFYWLLYRPWSVFKRFNTIRRFKNQYLSRTGLFRLQQHSPKSFRLQRRCYTEKPLLQHRPLISIVTPSFNQGAFIERTIKSVIDQAYPRLQYIIQDGASKDGTGSVLKRYAADALIESFPDQGQANALNLGFAKTDGEIMAWLNSDDMLLPGTLHYVADYFAKHPEVDLVYGHRIIIDSDDQCIGHWILPPHDRRVLLWSDYIPQETMFWRRRLWSKVGGHIDESFDFAMDWELLLRFQKADAAMVRLPRFMGGFRVHENHKSTSQYELGQMEMDRVRFMAHGRHVTQREIDNGIKPYILKARIWKSLFHLGIIKL